MEDHNELELGAGEIVVRFRGAVAFDPADRVATASFVRQAMRAAQTFLNRQRSTPIRTPGRRDRRPRRRRAVNSATRCRGSTTRSADDPEQPRQPERRLTPAELAIVRALIVAARCATASTRRRRAERTHCSRCSCAFADAATRGRSPERAWCRSCEVARRLAAPSKARRTDAFVSVTRSAAGGEPDPVAAAPRYPTRNAA